MWSSDSRTRPEEKDHSEYLTNIIFGNDKMSRIIPVDNKKIQLAKGRRVTIDPNNYLLSNSFPT